LKETAQPTANNIQSRLLLAHTATSLGAPRESKAGIWPMLFSQQEPYNYT